MRRDQKKNFIQNREGPHEEAETQRKALRRGKNLAFSKDTCLEKERVRSKVKPRKGVGGTETEVGLDVKLGRDPMRRGLTFARIERKTPVLRPAFQSNRSSLCGLHRSRDRGRGGPDGHIVSVKRAADGRRQRTRKIIDEK